jgi:hypothetical protein
VPGPGGNVLVIVRNSRGVQGGDRNVQRNWFHIRAAAVSVWQEEVELTRARREAVTRLHEDPADRGAARLLAADIASAASAASASLQADLRARLTEEIGNPRIAPLAGELINETGRQVGVHGHARVKVEVENCTAFNVDALTHELLVAAQYVSALDAASPRQPKSRRLTRHQLAPPQTCGGCRHRHPCNFPSRCRAGRNQAHHPAALHSEHPDVSAAILSVV